MSGSSLSPREVERLAVLRVVLLAADPQAVKVEVWRADALLLLAAVDRLAQRKEPAVQAHESVTGTLAGSYITGTIYITPSAAAAERGEPR